MDNRESNPILSANLSTDNSIPLYFQLESLIKRCISAGLVRPGDMLPSEAELCRSLGISRSTVRQAIGELEEEGLVLRHQGKGTFIAEPKLHRRSENIYSFTAEATSMGLSPSSTLVDFTVITPTEDLRRMLELQSRDIPVYRVSRIRRVNGVPLMLETSYYPAYIYPGLTEELVRTHSLYSLLYDRGIVPVSAVDTYEAVRLEAGEAGLLETKPGSAGFSHQRITRSENGEVFELTQSVMRGDRTKLEISMHRDGVTFTRSFER
jgi:GntR family transcriptional regulator